MNTNVVEIFLHPPAAEQTGAGLQILLKLLDWPFLMAVILVVFFLIFRESLKELIKQIKTINLKDGSAEFEKFFQQVDSQLENFDKESFPVTPASRSQGVQFANEKTVNTQDVASDPLNRIMDALLSPKFRWRTVSRLAVIAGVSESEAMTLLRSLEVEFDVNKSGQKIAKLKSR